MIRVLGIGGSAYPNENIGDIVVRRLSRLNQKDGIIYYPYTPVYSGIIDAIEEGDYIIVVDGTLYGMAPGVVSKIELEDCSKYMDSLSIGSLLDKVLNIKKHISGLFIGIETVGPVEEKSLDIRLIERLNEIVTEVSGIINKVYFKI